MQPAWGHYPDTILRFPQTGLSIDLRLPLSRSLRQQLGDLGLGGAFAVITACNPLGSRLDAAANRRLTSVLAALVRERYPAAPEAHGGSPDHQHEEPGWAIAIPLPEAQRLAAQFLQNAVFWFDGERFVIVPVLAPGPELPLPAP
jgi:hypothetical protein